MLIFSFINYISNILSCNESHFKFQNKKTLFVIECICNKVCINHVQISNIRHILQNLFKIAVDVHNTSFGSQTDGPTNGKAKGLLLIFTHADEICFSVLQKFHNLYAFLIKSLSFTDIDVRSTHQQLLQTVAHHSIQPPPAPPAPPARPPKDLSTGTKPIPNTSLGKNPIDLSSFSASSKDMTEAEWKESKCMNYIILLW